MDILSRPVLPHQVQGEAIAQLGNNAALRRYIEAIVQREVVEYFSARQSYDAHIRMVAIIEFAQVLLKAEIIAALLPQQPKR